MPYSGIRRTWLYQPWDRNMVPAYILAVPVGGTQTFVLPDFVQFPGIVNDKGTQQNWPNETLHTIANNLAENAKYLKKCWSELHKGGTPKSRLRSGVLGDGGELEGKTLIICASGPSLAGNLKEIARARLEGPDVRVMSVNRAATAVKSDYVVILERWCPEAWRTEAVFELQKDAKLIIAPQAHFALPRAWKDPENIYWGRIAMGNFPDLNWLTMMDVAASTSAASAIRVGYELGARKIILCGFDYAAEFESFPAMAELSEAVHDGRAAALHLLSEHVRDDKTAEAKTLAERVIKTDEEIDKKNCCLAWRAIKFYFDQDFKDTEYYNRDARFMAWFPAKALDGHMVGVVYELLECAEKTKCVLGCIESGSDCVCINASMGGVLDWRGVDGKAAHPPMSLAEALAWRT